VISLLIKPGRSIHEKKISKLITNDILDEKENNIFGINAGVGDNENKKEFYNKVNSLTPTNNASDENAIDRNTYSINSDIPNNNFNHFHDDDMNTKCLTFYFFFILFIFF
jgi:hypothetical protein